MLAHWKWNETFLYLENFHSFFDFLKIWQKWYHSTRLVTLNKNMYKLYVKHAHSPRKLEKTSKQTNCRNTWLRILDSHFYEKNKWQLFFNAFPVMGRVLKLVFKVENIQCIDEIHCIDAVDDFKLGILDSQIFDKKNASTFFKAFSLRFQSNDSNFKYRWNTLYWRSRLLWKKPSLCVP